jgi:4-amino-4-deoxy-L-arabinose transferase-like glycosyltransferase
LGLGLIALLYRAYLRTVYWGHEEEDWGNLQLIRGVLDNPFSQVETEHMPLFTWLAALSTAIIGDPEVGAEIIAIGAGAGTVAITTWIGMRWFHPGVGLLAGVLLCFQPEAALYSATPLREALFTLTVMGGIALLGSRREFLAGVLFSLAFLTRFNLAFSILPALVLWALRPQLSPPLRRGRLVTLAITTFTVVGWATYYYSQEGTWAFWTGVMDRNTGDAVADLFVGERIRAVLGAVSGVVFLVLPRHVGWLLVPLAFCGALRLRSASIENEDGAKWLTLCAAGTLGLLITTALVSAYDWTHNLYWKWLTPSVPFFCILGVHGGRVVFQGIQEHPYLQGLRPRSIGLSRLRIGAVTLLLAITLGGFIVETNKQIETSSRTYGTQVRIAEWFDAEWEGKGRILTWAYSIPAAYLQRQHREFPVRTWHDEGIPSDDGEAFGTWLLEQQVNLVLWYGEDGTGASDVAAFLGVGGEHQLGPVRLKALVSEPSYGVTAFLVVASDLRQPSSIPSAAWFLGDES